jgi:hypothetical protein
MAADDQESKLFYINTERDFSQRFNLGKLMEFCVDNYDPITSDILLELKSLDQGGIYTVRGEENNPDLIAFRIFGDTQFWWILMQYNSITEIADIENGQEIKFPSISALEDFYFSLKLRQKGDS